MYEKIFFIGGFHRTGSTLLSSILCQNPEIHIEGKSALAQMMWDSLKAVENNVNLLVANKKNNFDYDLITEIPHIYYKNNNRKIVIDKNPYWTNINNISLIEKYIDKNFKMIVLYRSVEEILKSTVKIFQKNNISLDPVYINNFNGIVINSQDFFYLLEKRKTPNHFLFIDYSDIINNTNEEIKKIYEFLELNSFEHNLINIKNYISSDDNFYNMNGLYEVRPVIEKKYIDLELDPVSKMICNEIDEKISYFKNIGVI